MGLVKISGDSAYLNSDKISIRFRQRDGFWCEQEVSLGECVYFGADAFLLARRTGYGGLEPLNCQSIRTLYDDEYRAALEFSGSTDKLTYKIVFNVTRGTMHINGSVAVKPIYNHCGWLCYALEAPRSSEHWCYPWVMSDLLRLPTNIGRSIGISRPNHIWTSLTGVPAVISRNDEIYGCLGFPMSYNYQNSSLTYNPESDSGVRIALGWGRTCGLDVEDAHEEYLAQREYRFPFQIVLAEGSFRNLAREWVYANDFSFDTRPKYSPGEVIDIFANGRSHENYLGQRRYVSHQQVGKYLVSGYQSGEDDTRIIIDLLPRNAYADIALWRRIGDNIFRARAADQMEFFFQCQADDGWFWENWDLGRDTFYFQGISEFGPRPDRQAMACEYAFKIARLFKEEGLELPSGWRKSMARCLDWILGTIQPDGAVPMTVVPKAYADQPVPVSGTSSGFVSELPGYANPENMKRMNPAPATRMLCAFIYLEDILEREDLCKARLQHEQWIIKNAYEHQKWWGHWNDTGHTATVFSALKFIEYCVSAFEKTAERRYLKMASETASWSFFQHVPKQLEWCRRYTRGAMIEQDNYMQYGNDIGDNLIFQAILKLGRLTGDDFFRDMGMQSITTAQMSLDDDPRHPWYGGWNTYIADSMGLTVPFDTDPVTGCATKYSISEGLLDLLICDEEGLLHKGVT